MTEKEGRAYSIGNAPGGKGTSVEYLQERLERAGRVLGVEIPAGAPERLFAFLGELAKWNKAYNLVGRRTTWPDLVEHCIDSLSALLVTGALAEETRAVDIGTGAGFPGIPLYLVGGPFELVLLEATRKKIAFLRHIKRSMALDGVRVEGLRAEEAAKKSGLRGSFDLALMRAVTDWRKALPLGSGFLKESGRLVLLAGAAAVEEIGKAQNYLQKAGFRLDRTRSSRRLTGRETAVLSLERTAG